ncbi:MAG: biotin transporter BioY [Chloroflexi bacterium]|nr:biotin transporter BioY [Chloroflexota bacterium]
MSYGTYADAARISLKSHTAAYDAGLVIGGSILLALSAQVAIPLPFSPVPVTAQTLVVLLIGATYGSRRAAACLIAYLAEGVAGLPVFAAGGAGFVHLLGPTGGYLAGFLAAAFVTGLLAEHGWDRRVATSLLAMLVGNVVIYAFGLAWLGRFVPIGQIAALGLLPFMPGDLAKTAVGTLLLPLGWKLTGWNQAPLP